MSNDRSKMTCDKAQATGDSHTRWSLDTLLESSLSLGAAHDPAKAMDEFLLLAMGWAGTSRGFLIMTDPWANGGHIAARGLAGEEETALLESLVAMAREGLESTMGCPTPHHGSRLIIRNPFASDSSWPQDMPLAVAFSTEACGPGILGLGPRVTEMVYSDWDADLLLAMTGHFIATLDRIRTARVIHKLNLDLSNRNESLQQALDENQTIRTDLDRRLFHLNAIGGAMADLSLHLRDVDRSVHTFLLTLCGVFGLERADLLLLDPEQPEPGIWARGGEPVSMDQDTAKSLVYACLETQDFKSLAPLSVHLQKVVQDTYDRAYPKAFTKASLLALFRLDESVTGLLALGKGSAPLQVSIPEDTFLALANTFVLFLRNARSFATISKLNTRLSRRNDDLEKTLAELTASKKRIEVLEKAKDQVRSVLQRYALRIGRPSWKDGLWIGIAGLILGLIYNISSPEGISPLPQEWTRPDPVLITQERSWELINQGALLIDARPKELFDQSHKDNAINLSASLFEFSYDMHLAEISLDTAIIVYGRTVSSRYDEDIAFRLEAQGHSQVYVLPGLP